jgi:hypothetical protein
MRLSLPRACPHLGVALALALALMVPQSAAAATFQDKATGLRLEAAPSGAEVCVILPVEGRDAEGCAGLDIAGLEAAFRAKVPGASAVALLRFPDGNVVITLVGFTALSLQSKDQIAKYIGGIREGAGIAGVTSQVYGSAPHSPYELGRVNGIDVVRYHLDFDVPKGHRIYAGSRTLGYTFAGKHAVDSLTFSTDPEHAAHLEPIAEAIVRTASMPDAGIEDFGRSEDFIRGKRIGRLVGLLAITVIPIAALVGALVFVALRLRKKPT